MPTVLSDNLLRAKAHAAVHKRVRINDLTNRFWDMERDCSRDEGSAAEDEWCIDEDAEACTVWGI